MRKLLLIPVIICIFAMIIVNHITGIDHTLYNEGQYTYSVDEFGDANIVGFVAADKQSVLTIPFSIADHKITSISTHVFDLDGFMEIYLPKGLTKIEENAFYNCDTLVNLTIPCKTEAVNGFEKMNNLKSLMIVCSDDSSRMQDYENESQRPWQVASESIERVVIDDGITYIGNNSFKNMSKLTDLELGKDVEVIGLSAFESDDKLAKLYLPENLVEIKNKAFKGVEEATIIVNSKLEIVEDESFENNCKFFLYNNDAIVNRFLELQLDSQKLELKSEFDSYTIKQGETITLKLQNDFNEKLKYTSFDQNIAMVNEKGKVLGLKEGKSVITISSPLVSTEVEINVEKNESDNIVIKTGEVYDIDISKYGIEETDEFYYDCSDEEVAIATIKNTIVALESGSTTISLTTEDNKFDMLVNVIGLVEEIEVGYESITINNGGYKVVNPTVYPSTAFNKQLEYIIEDESIAKVDGNGKVTGKADGITNLIIRSLDGSEVEKKIEVIVANATISVNNAPVVLMPDKVYRLSASSNDGSKLSYLVVDESIAKVDSNGVVTGVSEGLTDVIIYNGNKTSFKKIKCIVYDAVSYGVDLSEWNGYYYTKDNFIKAKKDGIDFVYLRAAYEDDYEDPVFQRNYSAAKEAGLEVGAYHYITATTVEKATSEAKWMLSILKGKKFEYPIMLDIESSKHRALSVYQWNVVVDTYCDIIKNAGYEVIVYSYASQLKRLNQPWDAHVANWGVTKPYFDHDYTIWQFTSDGVVKGFKGRVDMNICFKDYSYIKENHLNGY